MLSILLKNKKFLFATSIFIILTTWWGWLQLNNLSGDTDQAELFSASYGIMALIGGIIGIQTSRHWGGMKSLIGLFIGFIAVGLLFQVLGQVTYSLYTYIYHIEIPYPSLGDVGYFGSVILYIIAGIYLLKALINKTTFAIKLNVLWSVLMPVVILISSYMIFLKSYEFDLTNPLLIFLDFGYPLGQAIYISLAILAYLLSRKYLGGLFRPLILFVIFGFMIQYLADFTFLFRVNRDLWVTGGVNDYTYLVSYYVMTSALILINVAYNNIQGSNKITSENK